MSLAFLQLALAVHLTARSPVFRAGHRIEPTRCCATDTRKNPTLYTEAAGALDTELTSVEMKLERPPSLLAPAGGWPQLITAVNSGADACYFGVRENFNAR